MGMSIGGGGEDEPMMDINTTPLIDILLVLLIMFIITIPVMTHAVKLDMPRPNPDQQLDEIQPVVIKLEIDFDGTILWNGTVVPNIDTLDGYFAREAQNDPQPELHLRPNKRASYDVVARVLAAAQRNGLLKIGFVGNEEFM